MMPITSPSSISSDKRGNPFIAASLCWDCLFIMAGFEGFSMSRTLSNFSSCLDSKGVLNRESGPAIWFTSVTFSSMTCGTFFDLTLGFTTAAIWLLPFWNSFNMSYRGISAGTLGKHSKNELYTFHAYVLERASKHMVKNKWAHLGILLIETALTGVSVSALTVRRLFT